MEPSDGESLARKHPLHLQDFCADVERWLSIRCAPCARAPEKAARCGLGGVESRVCRCPGYPRTHLVVAPFRERHSGALSAGHLQPSRKARLPCERDEEAERYDVPRLLIQWVHGWVGEGGCGGRVEGTVEDNVPSGGEYPFDISRPRDGSVQLHLIHLLHLNKSLEKEKPGMIDSPEKETTTGKEATRRPPAAAAAAAAAAARSQPDGVRRASAAPAP